MLREWFSRDARAVERVLGGDRDAFSEIVERHLPAVKALAYSRARNVHDADDIAQETFLKAYKSLGTLREPGKLGPWLMSIARNVSSTMLASRQRPEAPPLEEAAATESDVAREELHGLLRTMVGDLDEKYRDVLLLHYFGGKSTKEIGVLLGISRESAQKRLQRGRDQLGQRLVTRLGEAFAGDAPKRDESRRIMSAILALPMAVPERTVAGPSHLAAGKTTPAGVYLGIGGVAVTAVAVFTWWTLDGYDQVNEMYAPVVEETVDGESDQAAVGPADAGSGGAGPVAASETAERTAGGDGFSIGGVVVTSSGDPIGGARVRGYSLGASGVPETRTDASGEFLLADLPPRAYRIRVTHEGFAGAIVPDVAPGTRDLRVELQGLGSFSFRVVDIIDQEPIGRFSYTDPLDGRVRDVADIQGRFQIDGLMPGKPFTTKIQAERYRTAGISLPLFELDEEDSVIEIGLERDTVISGRVINAGGAPVSGATVMLSGRSTSTTSTGESGSFRFANRRITRNNTSNNLPRRVYAHHGDYGVGWGGLVQDPSAWELETVIRLEPPGELEVYLDDFEPSEWSNGNFSLDYLTVDLVDLPSSGMYAAKTYDQRQLDFFNRYASASPALEPPGDPLARVGQLFPGKVRVEVTIYDK